MNTSSELIHLNSRDNVAVSRQELSSGHVIKPHELMCKSHIPAGHKIAVTDIDKDAPVYKYGSGIGYAATKIQKGDHVHSHNLYMKDISQEYAVGIDKRDTRFTDSDNGATFNGYVRKNGRVGTRNYIGVLSTVNCSASVSHFIADACNKTLAHRFDNIDGVVGLSHGAGCCMTIGGEGLAILQRTMAGFAQNPNFGGILVVGLGCEVNLVTTFMETMQLSESPLLKTLNIQDLGGTRQTITRALEVLETMMPLVASARREPVSAEHLTLGLECGGSDAYSGITSNPALGAAADLLVQNRGTVILAETPEIYGAEHLLIQRAVNQGVADKLIEKIKWWKAYTKKHNAQINNNPTPGNKEGGLTTILEKSLGAVAKAGTTNLNDVFSYAQPVTTKGMVFMDTPGYDTVSITGMIAGGANMVCFTTGRGSVVGFKPVPCLKLSSNTAMYNRLCDDMDINCGPVLDEGVPVKEMGEKIFASILETASGKKTLSEAHGYGDHEFVPWHIGAVL
jgi:altronate dehydratase